MECLGENCRQSRCSPALVAKESESKKKGLAYPTEPPTVPGTVLGAEDSQEQKIENILGLTDLVEQT